MSEFDIFQETDFDRPFTVDTIGDETDYKLAIGISIGTGVFALIIAILCKFLIFIKVTFILGIIKHRRRYLARREMDRMGIRL